jgi:hypothetical protein
MKRVSTYLYIQIEASEEFDKGPHKCSLGFINTGNTVEEIADTTINIDIQVTIYTQSGTNII